VFAAVAEVGQHLQHRLVVGELLDVMVGQQALPFIVLQPFLQVPHRLRERFGKVLRIHTSAPAVASGPANARLYQRHARSHWCSQRSKGITIRALRAGKTAGRYATR
jgi:hypothetical protein